MTSYYDTGTVTLINGSPAVVGNGTGWQLALISGGNVIVEALGNPLPIASVNSDNSITAELKWTGASGTYEYRIQSESAYAKALDENSRNLSYLLSEMRNGTLYKYDAAGNLADRAFHDAKPKGFSYLVFAGTSAQLYVKASATSGDWAGPYAYGTGPQGIPGPIGVLNPMGTYNPATAYAANDNVLYNGSSWVALQATTGNAPPSLPTTENAYWALLAVKGQDGLGTGDVVGPAVSVAGNIPSFSDTTGKLLSDSGIPAGTIPDIPRGLLWGLSFSNNASDAANDINISAGVAADENTITPKVMRLTAGVTRQLDVAFGSGNGGRFDASVSDGWWHVFIISNGTATSIGLSKSMDPTAEPNYPTGYTSYRRISSVQRLSGSLIGMRQYGDLFFRVSGVVVSAFAGGFTSQLLGTGAPIGPRTRPIIRVTSSVAAASSSSTNVGDADSGAAGNQIQANFAPGALVNIVDIFTTNALGQLYFSSTAAGTVYSFELTCLGWIDNRGRV